MKRNLIILAVLGGLAATHVVAWSLGRRSWRADAPPTIEYPLQAYSPQVFVSPGLSDNILKRDLRLRIDSKRGYSTSCTLSAEGSHPSGCHIDGSRYWQDANRLLAVSPAGHLVLMIRDEGTVSGRSFHSATTESAMVFFPFGTETLVTVFGDAEVKGVFTDGAAAAEPSNGVANTPPQGMSRQARQR